MKIFLDNNATTQVDPFVLEAMVEELKSLPSNPSSVHAFGRAAKEKLEKARKTIADYFQVPSQSIIFTSGGTESINLLLRGSCLNYSGAHILTSDVEHSSVFHTLQSLEKKGARISFLPAGLWGAVQPDQIEQAITKETRLIVLGAANGETGVKIDLNAIASLAQKHNIPFIVDGVALLGKDHFTIPSGVVGMAFSGHKFHGPKGVGFAVIKPHLQLQPLHTGGGQEFAKRPGTENLPGIVGLACAIERLKWELSEAENKMRTLRDYLEQRLKKEIPELEINGKGPRVSNTSNLAFPHLDGETLLIQLDLAGIAVSHGSACAAGALEPSRVLLNMGIARKTAKNSLRLSLSRFTTKDEIDIVIDTILRCVKN